MKFIIVLCGLFLTTTAYNFQELKINRRITTSSNHDILGYHDSIVNIVPDSLTSIRIAEIILGNIYGKKYIKRCRPFRSELKDGEIWVVTGSMHRKFTVGGSPVIYIRKNDCTILKFYHTR